MRDLILLVLCALSLAACVAPSADTSAPGSEGARRFLWVTRWDYRTDEDVVRLVREADESGFDALVFQVRGAASTFYPSALEPRAEELAGMPADHDPLRTAVREARARGLELHAWINCVPSWWGSTPPEARDHVYHTHPEWHWYDQRGDRQAFSEDFYVSLNPCLPEVREHVVAVCEELVTGYDLDGLHLDYIRFPKEPPATPRGSGSDWPRDARTLELYREATGLAPDDDPQRWSDWRADQVTELVRGIRSMIDGRAPGVVLSAAVGSEPEYAVEAYHQDVLAWIGEGLLDLVLPMNYSADTALFVERMERWQAHAADVPVVMGVMVKGEAGVRAEQLRLAGAAYPRIAVFAYHDLFDSRNEVLTTQDEAGHQERAARREVLLGEVPAAD
jgi:uncharacterized lipoprotein YddW (UPF0748 family)